MNQYHEPYEEFYERMADELARFAQLVANDDRFDCEYCVNHVREDLLLVLNIIEKDKKKERAQ